VLTHVSIPPMGGLVLTLALKGLSIGRLEVFAARRLHADEVTLGATDVCAIAKAVGFGALAIVHGGHCGC